MGAVSADGRLRCDALGCVYRVGGTSVALARTEDALRDDCEAADVVVADVAVFAPCSADAVVDRLDVWRRGAHAIWLTDDGPRIESVADGRGDRPWVLPRHRPQGARNQPAP